MNKRVIAGAIDIARRCGLIVDAAVPLRSTNNLVVWLSPAPVVAKIGIGRHAQLRIELEVALELIARGGPVVAPAPAIPAIVHACEGFDVTFWQYHAQMDSPDDAPASVGVAMRRLHFALAQISPGLRARLPSYERELALARVLLADSAGAPALRGSDRQLLSATFDRLFAILQQRAPADSHIAIHGSPHSYNVLRVDGERRFIDFETACTGPAEWDAANLCDEAVESYALALDRQLLWACRGMASVWTAALCWQDVERGDMREHAEMHLKNVRENVAPHV